MRLRSLVYALSLILIVLSCLWLFLGGKGTWSKDVSPKAEPAEDSRLSRPTTLSTRGPTSSPTISERMKERDFNTLKVDLPEPEDKPWPGPFWNSSNFRSPETAKAALEVLPIWIRKAVLDGNKNQAGKYLFSLLSYLDDSDKNLRNNAALILYKLGSRDARLLNALKTGIESDDSRNTASSLSEWRGGISQRAAILEHLRFYGDHTLDDHIEATFDQLPEKGLYTQSGSYNYAAIELAKYLETIGRSRTDDFWLERLELSSGMVDAISVLRDRKSVDLVSILRPKIDATSKSVTSLTAAAFVYGMTGEAVYETQLIQEIEEGIQSGSPVVMLEFALQGLLDGKSNQAQAILKGALASEALGYQEMALAALGRVPEASSIRMIKDYATPIIEKDLIPNAAFKALIEMSNQQSDEAYEALKSSVLSRNGRSEADFEALDFAKSHRAKFIR
jgi:HEAT repeat protein